MLKNDSSGNTEKGQLTSGHNISYWLSSEERPLQFEKLNDHASTDILVIGGGISGLSTAYCLARSGRSVILVEDGFIGSGESGRTTAHLTCALDDRYYELEKLFDENVARLAANSHMAAIEWISNTIKLNNIDCNLKIVDGYLFLHPTDSLENLEKEYQSTKNAGLITEMLSHIPAINGGEGKKCIKFFNQAQFHIMKYLKALSLICSEMGVKIYTETKAENISQQGAKANGFTIKANHIVVATNSPINDWVTMHTKQWPYRSYVIGAKVQKGKLPYSLWWDSGDQNSPWITKPYHYVRLEELDKQYDLLIAGGEDHRTGQADEENISEEDRYEKLFQWTKKHFPDIEEVIYKWSGQVMEPLDSLAYIGKNPGDKNIYIITGDSGNGMTHGTLGGMIVSDIINGVKNPWVDLYDPSRITLKTTLDYLKEAGNMVAQYGDWFTGGEEKNANEMREGDGAVLTEGYRKITVYRDSEGQIHKCSAVCPHLGGILQWNADEKTFDCPLHGSRFTATGKVINGPAVSDLKKIPHENN